MSTNQHPSIPEQTSRDLLHLLVRLWALQGGWKFKVRIVNCNEDSDWRLPCERAGEPFPKGGKINNVVPKMTRCRHAMTLVRLPIGMWTVQSSSEPHSHSSGLSTGCAPFSLALTSEQNEYIEAQIRLPVPPGSKAIKDLFAKRWPETPITSKLLRARLQRVGRYQRKIAEEIADVYRMLKAKYGIVPDNMTAVTEGSGEAVETVGREREDHIEEVIHEDVWGRDFGTAKVPPNDFPGELDQEERGGFATCRNILRFATQLLQLPWASGSVCQSSVTQTADMSAWAM